MIEITKFSVVTRGLWNPRIFNPDWLGVLFKTTNDKPEKAPDIQIKGIVNLNELLAFYEFDNIQIYPRYESLTIETKNISSARYVLVLIDEILRQLNHTPITALGVNIFYNLYDEKTDFCNYLANFREPGFKSFRPAQFQYKKVNPTEYSKNIFVLKYGEPLSIHFNYHYDNQALKDLIFNDNRISLLFDHISESEGILK